MREATVDLIEALGEEGRGLDHIETLDWAPETDTGADAADVDRGGGRYDAVDLGGGRYRVIDRRNDGDGIE